MSTHGRHGNGRTLAVLAAFACTVGLGCTLDSALAGAGIPGTRISAEISDFATRGDYYDAFVAAGGFRYRFVFFRTADCKTVLSSTEGAVFVWLGAYGRVTANDLRCDAVGVLSLREWRDRGPRRTREPLPRRQANFRVIYRDDDIVQLRGRFPLAGAVGIPGGRADLVGFVPNDPVCEAFVERGVASMEFRASGPQPAVLLDRNNICPMMGFAQPPPQA